MIFVYFWILSIPQKDVLLDISHKEMIVMDISIMKKYHNSISMFVITIMIFGIFSIISPVFANAQTDDSINPRVEWDIIHQIKTDGAWWSTLRGGGVRTYR